MKLMKGNVEERELQLIVIVYLSSGTYLCGRFVNGVHPVDPVTTRTLLKAKVVDHTTLRERIVLKNKIKKISNVGIE